MSINGQLLNFNIKGDDVLLNISGSVIQRDGFRIETTFKN